MGTKKRLRSIRTLIFLFYIVAVSAPLILAQEKQTSTEPDKRSLQVVLPRINGPVTLDGRADEIAWEGIKSLPIVMHKPDFMSEPSEKSEFLLAYDDDFVYLAGKLYMVDPTKIRAASKKRDQMELSSDFLGIIIDTFNDKENALGFFTTPAGLRFDFTVFNDGTPPEPTQYPINGSWNTFWDVATVRDDTGWFAEMRIPFSSLRFQDKNGHIVMGVVVWRWIASKAETDIFPAIPPNWGFWSSFKPSQAQEVVFEGIESRNPLYITPYVLSGLGQSYALNEEKTAYPRNDDWSFEAGLDVKYGLTSNLTLDVTANTDFAQVEADDQQVNLTRFSLFFPEKRLFFQERESNFAFSFGGNDRLFYSRRIGIYQGNPVRIYGGARIVGRAGPWDLGFLNMQTARIEDNPSENFGVIRVRRRVFNPYSYVGGIATSRIGTDGNYNAAYGLSGIFRLFGNDYLTVRWAQTFDKELGKGSSFLDRSRMFINWERRTYEGLGYDLNFSRAGNDYNPGIGFETRSDFTRFGNNVLYGWIPGKESSLQYHYISADGFIILNNSDGSTESADFGPGWDFGTKSGTYGYIQVKMYYENIKKSFSLSKDTEVLPGKYNFYGLVGSVWTPMGNPFYSVVFFRAGSFYDGSRITCSVSPRWSLSSDLQLKGMYQINWINFPDRQQEFAAHVARLRLEVTLSTKFSAMAFVQYNSAVDAVIANVRIRYNPREGNDLYIVYNEGFNSDRARDIPILPLTSSRTIMIKYSYTFNF